MKAKKSKILLFSLVGVLILSSLGIGLFFGLRRFFNKDIPQADFAEVLSDNLDSDGDGLLDEEENKLGTNIYNKDTDGDGFEDGEEIKLGYDPLKTQSGVNIDIDNDGLTGADEQKYGTNPSLADSDYDGFTDGEEIASGNDPLKANLSDYVALNAVANHVDEIDNNNQGETIIDVTNEDINQIDYLESALSSSNIDTFKENIGDYMDSTEELDTEQGTIILPEIKNENINILSSDTNEDKQNYRNSIQNIFSNNVSYFNDYSNQSIALNENQGLGLMSEFTLFIQNTAAQVQEAAVPNNPDLIELHKNLMASLIRSENLLADIDKNSGTSDQDATINVMNSFNELSTIISNIIFDQILPDIQEKTA